MYSLLAVLSISIIHVLYVKIVRRCNHTYRLRAHVDTIYNDAYRLRAHCDTVYNDAYRLRAHCDTVCTGLLYVSRRRQAHQM